MAKYSLQEVLNEIDAQIKTNHNQEITGAIANAVMKMMAQQTKDSDYVNHVNEFLGSTTVRDAINKLAVENIPAWDAAKSYTAGYVVYFDGALYRAQLNIPYGGPTPDNTNKWLKIGGTASGDYVRLIGNDIIYGTKTFMDTIRANQIKPVLDGGTVYVNGFPVQPETLDAGIF